MANGDNFDNYLSSSSLTCELKIIGAKNIKTKHKGNLFIRCYLSEGSNNNNRIQVNTKEIVSSQKDDYIFWDDSFSLECKGTQDSIQNLKEQSVFFELRWRNTKAFLGKIGGSQVVATAETPWKHVLDAPKMEFQKWVPMNVNEDGKLLKFEEGVKPPCLQIVMKVEASRVETMEEMRRRRRRERRREWDDECGCGCRSNGCCSSCADNELLFIGATFDDF
ncbi:uncharacterized protein LOC130820158 [Amaranthus tricolor]|uniref:uncharacterized protein LOC130820158 n=1 Tax=Amaranthus tricolor TaxID=29722 RepID=UPI00258CA358|nr:uncharacterized protein LOC130820158 [Amaranthus tricolor]